MAENKGKGLDLIRMTITLMIIYNFFYLSGKYLPTFIPEIIQPIYEYILKHGFVFTLLEALGAISLFVDLVGGWDRRKGAKKKRQVFIVIFLVLLFLLKFTLRILDSLLPDFS